MIYQGTKHRRCNIIEYTGQMNKGAIIILRQLKALDGGESGWLKMSEDAVLGLT